MKFTIEGKYATGGTDSFQLVGGLMLDLHEKKAPLISQKMEEKSLELGRTEAQSTVTPKAEKQVEESQRLEEQPIVARRVVPESKQELELLLEKKSSDLTEDDISELLKQKRHYSRTSTVWLSLTMAGFVGALMVGAEDIASHKFSYRANRNDKNVSIFATSGLFLVGVVALFPTLRDNGLASKIQDKLEVVNLKKGINLLPNDGVNLIVMKYSF
jgi:DNA-directed RNA polymerase subunit F